MSRRLASILQFLLAMVTAMAAGSAACAEAPTVIAPLQVEPDRNNVNLHNGKTRIEMPVLSVPAAPNLRYDRLQNAAPYFTARVYTALSDDHDSRSYAIHIGAESSDAIDCYDDECTSVTGSGAIFDWRHRSYRQAGSGVFWEFTSRSVETPSPNRVLTYYATVATYPNGEVIGFEYDTAAPNLPFNRVLHRPRKLTSSLGYYIAITYAGDSDPLASDWSRVTQAALYRAGATPMLLRRFTYSGATIRDHGASTGDDGRDYVCTGCVSGLGAEIEVSAGSMRLPGEQAPELPPTLQITPLNGGNNPVVGAVTRDGVVWSYSYENLRLQPGTSRWLFDKMIVNGPNGFQQVYDVANSYRSVYEQATNRIHTTITRVTTRLSLNPTVSRFTSYYYGYGDRPTRIVYPELNEVSVVYDAYGNIISRTSTPKPNSGLSTITEYANFPIAGCSDARCYRPSWTKDGLGRQTDYSHDENGQLTEQLDPADNVGVRRRTSITYEAGALRRRTSVRVCADSGASCPANSPIRTEYDYGDGTLLPSAERRIDAAQNVTLTTSYGYDPAGRLLSTVPPSGGSDAATYNRYDVYGRRTWEIGARSAANGLRIATRFTYRDSDDKPVGTETGTLPDVDSTNLSVFRRTEIGYDGRRNPVREALSSASGTTFGVTDKSYDDQGRPVCTAVRMNPAAFASLPASACTPGTQGSDGPDRITRTVYDAAGQRLQLREGVGTADEGAAATWAYNANGQVTSVIDGNGNRADLRYDGHGRQDRWFFPSTTRPAAFDDSTPASALASAGSVNANDWEGYGYDANGNRLQLRRRDGRVLVFDYDALNRVTMKRAWQSGVGVTSETDYAYDLRGLQLSATFGAGGPGILNAYDGFGRLASSTTTMGGVGRTLTHQYDANGNRTRITHPDGQVFTYGYDGLNRLAGVYQDAGTGTWLDLFAYNPQGLLAARAERYASEVAYGYDPIGRPIALTSIFYGGAGTVTLGFGLNPAGQITSVARDNDAYAWTGHYNVNRGYTANGLNQYTPAGSAGFAYDANGNLSSDGANFYVYDIENRLVSASGAHNAGLAYDPLGRLWQVTGTAGTTQFLYDGDALIAEYDNAGTMTKRYVHGSDAGADDPLLSYDGPIGPTIRWFHADHQGSIVALTAAGTGATPAINSYDEYGIPAAANTGRFQYTGQAWLAELGMYYYKARMYSPTLGRFLQVDPIGYDDQFNLYAYVENDPVNRADPSGTGDLCPTGCHGDPDDPGTAQRQLRAGQIMAIAAGFAASEAIGAGAVAMLPRVLVWAQRFLGLGGEARATVQAAVRSTDEIRATTTADRVGVGRHAGESIPARSGARDFTRGERREVNRIGSQTGCHTCGSTTPGTKSGNFVPDHQPSSSINPPGNPQRIYPQCLRCSQEQGLELARRLREGR